MKEKKMWGDLKKVKLRIAKDIVLDF